MSTIYAKLQGRTGNHMFIAAAAYGIANAKGNFAAVKSQIAADIAKSKISHLTADKVAIQALKNAIATGQVNDYDSYKDTVLAIKQEIVSKLRTGPVGNIHAANFWNDFDRKLQYIGGGNEAEAGFNLINKFGGKANPSMLDMGKEMRDVGTKMASPLIDD